MTIYGDYVHYLVRADNCELSGGDLGAVSLSAT